MSYPRTPTTTTSSATTTPNATPNEPYDASPATPTVWATPSVSTPSKPHSSPNPSSLTAIFDAGNVPSYAEVLGESTRSPWCLMSMCSRNGMRVPHVICSRNLIPEGEGLVFGGEDEGLLDPVDVPGQVGRVGLGVEQL